MVAVLTSLVDGDLDHHVNVAQMGVGAARASAFVLAGVTDQGDVDIGQPSWTCCKFAAVMF